MAVVQEEAGAARVDHGLWAGPRYTTHPLVREVAAKMLASRNPEERMQACRAFVQFMLSCGADIENYVGTGSEAQIITQELLSMELANIRGLARLLTELACEILSPQHPRPLVGLAALLWDLGQLVAAAELGRATLRALEPNHTELAYARTRLEFMLTHEGMLDQAEKLARKTLDGMITNLGEYHADTVNAREYLALTLLQLELIQPSPAGQAGAVPLSTTLRFLRPLQLFMKGLADNVVIVTARAELYEPEVARRAKAALFRQLPFKSSPAPAGRRGVQKLAGAEAARVGRLQQAELQARKAFEITDNDEVGKLQCAVLQAREAAQGSEHLDTVFARANMAATLRKRGQSVKAAELLRGVEAVQVQVLGERHPDTVSTRAELKRSNLSARAVSAGRARRLGLRRMTGWVNDTGQCSRHAARRRGQSTWALYPRGQTWLPRCASAASWTKQQSMLWLLRSRCWEKGIQTLSGRMQGWSICC